MLANIFNSLSFSRLYNIVSECQLKKITQNGFGENFPNHDLAQGLLGRFPHHRGVFLFSLGWGDYPPKTPGGANTIQPPKPNSIT